MAHLDMMGLMWRYYAVIVGHRDEARAFSREDGILSCERIEPASGSAAPSCLLLRARDAGHAILLCRGTVTPDEWRRSLSIAQSPLPWGFPGAVHAGFLRQFALLERTAMRRLWSERSSVRALTVVGHSMGCAMAALAASRCLAGKNSVRIRGLLVGSPRIGSPEFAAALGRRCDLLTLVNVRDPFATLPPIAVPRHVWSSATWDYAHVGRVESFDDAGEGSVMDAHMLFPYWEHLQSRGMVHRPGR